MDIFSRLRIAKDCIDRCHDGIASDLLGYALEQVNKASFHLSEVAFQIHRQIIVDDHDKPKPNGQA